MSVDICCIGHITHDKIITPNKEVHQPGGAVYYFAHGLQALEPQKHNISFKVITSLANKDIQSVNEMQNKGIDVEVIPSRETVYFENIYGSNMNNRQQRVLATADPFDLEKVKHVDARYIVLGSLLADDFSLDTIKYLHQKGTLVVDAQGYLRNVQNQQVHAIDWTWKKEAIKYIDILKVNEYEAEVLTGEKDLHKAIKMLANWGAKEVLLTLGSFGSIVLCEGKEYVIPAYEPLKIVDATGCGDTYVMGYVFYRAQGKSAHEAGKFGAAVSTLKLEGFGPFNGTYNEATQRIPKL